MKKTFDDYYLGLDIGTDSVGWAITDLNYKILKFNGKALWGVRLFESGSTAAERRTFRSSRRRLERRNRRISILQELFANEISKVDMGFYQRLSDSKFLRDDKTEDQRYALFNDKNFNDVTYYEKYPTIYHLRYDLMKSDTPHDVRLVYLAIHHIIKHRGHFLFEGDGIECTTSIKDTLSLLEQHIMDEYNIELLFEDKEQIERVLKNRDLTITNKKSMLKKCISMPPEYNKMYNGIITLISGGSEYLYNLYMDNNLKDAEISKISFSNFDDKEEKLEELLGERYYLISIIKSIFDWSILSTILNGHASLSESKVTIYDEHKSDLKMLKKIVKDYCPDEYDNIFRRTDIKGNYCSYVGFNKNNKFKESADNKCQHADLLNFLKNKLKDIKCDNPDFNYIMNKIDNGNFLQKQVTANNGVIPRQVHEHELRLILANAEKYLPFLSEHDETGYSVSEKILKLFQFRVPYYVGPLNDTHKTETSKQCWVVRKKGKIYPWNFEEIVNLEESATNFITKMTNKCTYLFGEDVLPKNSLLYSKFMVLNELNNLKINGEAISVELKQKIYNEKFLSGKKVTGKALKTYLKKEGLIEDTDELSGFDIDFKATLASHRDFNRILNDKAKDTDMVEEIIKWIVLFGEDKHLLKSRIQNAYGSILSEDEIKEILKLKYSGWGRLSKKLLKDLVHIDKSNSEANSLITMMWKTNCNLMELLTDNYDFVSLIKLHNDDIEDSATLSYEAVDKLYVSPSVKRSIWQTITIVKELSKVMGHEPKKIFVEMTRSHEESERKDSRKSRLISLYNNCKEEIRYWCNDANRDWCSEISDKWSESDLRSKKLYLYYTQMGKCMYTGKDISLDELWNKDIYDIDHIYPRSKVKDDSILNNLVLVDKRYNNNVKKDIYPLPKDIQSRRKEFWYMLKEKELITREKYNRLVRTSGFSIDELGGFIARQIVETSQSTKAVAEILKKVYTNTNIVYVKAGNVSAFRHENNFVKVREINDYHHAKDAYLNIVVGNVYDSKFTRNPINFLKKHPTYKYSLNRMYDYNVTDIDGTIAWVADNHESMKQVENVMRKNNILFTRYAHEQKGELFDQNPLKKGKGQTPLKSNMPIERYGGYNNIKSAYYFLVEHTSVKHERIRTLETVYIKDKHKFEESLESKINYCVNELQLNDPRIIIDKIKINTLFCINGFYMHLSSRTNDSIIYKGANQLCISPDCEAYIKRIVKFIERTRKAKFNIALVPEDDINAIQNLYTYDHLLHKLKNTIYGVKLSKQAKILESNRNKFIQFDNETQCEIIYQILILFACNISQANLSLLCNGKNKKTGTITTNKNISSLNSIQIINQSPTGIFEQKIDLLKI